MIHLITSLTDRQADTYVQRGFRVARLSPKEWSKEFRVLGGSECHIRANGRYGLSVSFAGSLAALALIEETLAELAA